MNYIKGFSEYLKVNYNHLALVPLKYINEDAIANAEKLCSKKPNIIVYCVDETHIALILKKTKFIIKIVEPPPFDHLINSIRNSSNGSMDECVICFDKLSKRFLCPQCSCVICPECVKRLKISSPQCPQCRIYLNLNVSEYTEKN